MVMEERDLLTQVFLYLKECPNLNNLYCKFVYRYKYINKITLSLSAPFGHCHNVF